MWLRLTCAGLFNVLPLHLTFELVVQCCWPITALSEVKPVESNPGLFSALKPFVLYSCCLFVENQVIKIPIKTD